MYDDDPLEHAFYGFLASQILCAVDELGLFEALAKGDSLTAAELGAVPPCPRRRSSAS